MSYFPLEVEVLSSDSLFSYKLNHLFKTYCMQNNIKYIEIINQLRNNRFGNDELFLDECHLTIKGNEIVANYLYSYYNKQIKSKLSGITN